MKLIKFKIILIIIILGNFTLSNLITTTNGQNIIINGNYYTMTTYYSTSYYIEIVSGSTLTINKLDLTGGYRPFIIDGGGTGIFSYCNFYNIKSYSTCPTTSSCYDGGAIYVYGSSSSYAILTISNSIFKGNTAYVTIIYYKINILLL